MRIGFVVNDIGTERGGYTTSRLAQAAINMGHEVWVMGVGDLIYEADDSVAARARAAPRSKYKDSQAYLKDLQGSNATVDRLCVDHLDVLMLRNDPADDAGSRSWAQTVAYEFARLALRRGVIVVNDPNGLAKAATKMYFQLFPEEVRPRTLITRDRDDVRAFARERGEAIVLKPLAGLGGRGVSLVHPDDLPDLDRVIESISRDGYVIAQEYLPEAARGDLRLFLMNGRPLRVKGKYAAFRRLRSGADTPSGTHAGGTRAAAEVGDEAIRIADIVRPKLVQDGMFFVGLDIVGDKLMEINVFSPGGLGSVQEFTKINFSRYVIEALERKTRYMGFYGRSFDNADLCTL